MPTLEMTAIFETALKLRNKFVHQTRYRALERRIFISYAVYATCPPLPFGKYLREA